MHLAHEGPELCVADRASAERHRSIALLRCCWGVNRACAQLRRAVSIHRAALTMPCGDRGRVDKNISNALHDLQRCRSSTGLQRMGMRCSRPTLCKPMMHSSSALSKEHVHDRGRAVTRFCIRRPFRSMFVLYCCAPWDEPADSRRIFTRCLAASSPVTAGGRPLPPSMSGLLLPRTDEGRELLHLTMLPDSATLHTDTSAVGYRT